MGVSETRDTILLLLRMCLPLEWEVLPFESVAVADGCSMLSKSFVSFSRDVWLTPVMVQKMEDLKLLQ